MSLGNNYTGRSVTGLRLLLTYKLVQTVNSRDMKRNLILISTLIFLISTSSFGQECKAYFPMKEGASFEVTNYNPKGKEEGKSIHTIKKVEQSGDNIMIDASMEIVTDKKTDEPMIFDYQAKCEDGKFVMNRFSGMSMEQMGMGTDREGIVGEKS